MHHLGCLNHLVSFITRLWRNLLKCYLCVSVWGLGLALLVGTFFRKKKKESWDSLLWVRVRIRINPKGLHLKRSSQLCVCVCVRFSGGSSAGVERLTFHSIGQLQTEKEWISCLTCHQLTPGQERWNCFEPSTKTRCFWFQPLGFTDQFWSDLGFRFVALKVSDIKAFLEFHS